MEMDVMRLISVEENSFVGHRTRTNEWRPFQDRRYATAISKKVQTSLHFQIQIAFFISKVSLAHYQI